MTQPKDYETFEEFIESEYKALSPYQKVIYHLQNHTVKLLLAAFAGGYWAGLHFGVFWQ